MKHSKKYERNFENGTTLNVTISVDIKNCDERDRTKMFSEFAQCSRDFYLNELKSIMRAD